MGDGIRDGRNAIRLVGMVLFVGNFGVYIATFCCNKIVFLSQSNCSSCVSPVPT